jgi:hypothetical protein
MFFLSLSQDQWDYIAGEVFPNLSAVYSAGDAAYKFFRTIDRIHTIDHDDEGRIKPFKATGII